MSDCHPATVPVAVAPVRRAPPEAKSEANARPERIVIVVGGRPVNHRWIVMRHVDHLGRTRQDLHDLVGDIKHA